MLIHNERPYPMEVPDVGIVDAGDDIEVPDKLGASLILQVDAWSEVKSKATKATKGD